MGDVGTQYRSCVYWYDVEQQKLALETRSLIQDAVTRLYQPDESKGEDAKSYSYPNPDGVGDLKWKVTTEIEPASQYEFYYAENYHQQRHAKVQDGMCGLRPLT